MITHTTRRVRATLLALALAMPVICTAAATPQSAVDELLAADRAFSAASARTDVIAGLSPMFAADVVMPTPLGQFADGKAAALAALRANADNARSHVEWTPVRGGMSADGQHGFTVGFMTLHLPDGSTTRLKYLSYWVKQPAGWRVVAYKRVRSGEGSPSLALMAPALPDQLVPPSTDAAVIARFRDSLDQAERSFSDLAQKIGLGAAFAQYGSADALNLGGASTPGLVVGPENIARLVAADRPATGSPLVWAPDKVLVASSGDLGVTIGMIHPNAPAAGEPASVPFFTIWRRPSPMAPWRYVAE
jgi:ketosteroid isomerase-like protein